jgi:hypothetical protein
MDNSPHGQLAPLGDFFYYIFSCNVKKLWVGGGVKKWGILILKTHTSLTTKEKWVWFHIYIYVCTKQIIVQNMCTFFNPSCASLVCHKGTDRKKSYGLKCWGGFPFFIYSF